MQTEQSKQKGLPEVTDSTLSPACQLWKKRSAQASAMYVSHRKNKKTTLEDKNNLCVKDIQTTKSSETSEAASTSKGRDLTPYWNEYAEELSNKLSLHTGIGYADLDSICSRESVKFMGQNSWFSIKQQCLRSKNLSQISAQSSMFSPVGFMDSDDTLMGLKKIRVYPKTSEQKKMLTNLCDAARFFYNRAIAYLKQPGTKANRFAIQKELLENVPDWAKDVPYKVKQMAIDDACIAVKNAKKKYIITNRVQDVRFRRRKDRRDTFYVPKTSVNAMGIFPRLIKELKVTEEIGDVDFDCKFLHDDGRFWVCIPHKKQIKVPENQRKLVISLDPGVRTFLTGFTFEGYCSIGASDFSRVFRLLYRLDECIGKRAKGSKRRYKKAISSLKFKVQNLISEIHSKTANILVRCFDNIVIPDFTPDKKMMEKLSSKTCRSMLTWAHARFRKTLQYKAKEYSANVYIQNEAYTSKTCSFCGAMQNIGSKKAIKCGCGASIGRDENGARGIFLRAMIDHPELKNSVSVSFS